MQSPIRPSVPVNATKTFRLNITSEVIPMDNHDLEMSLCYFGLFLEWLSLDPNRMSLINHVEEAVKCHAKCMRFAGRL